LVNTVNSPCKGVTVFNVEYSVHDPQEPADPVGDAHGPARVLRHFESDGPASITDLALEALAYHDAGYAPIPIRPGTKSAGVRWRPYQEERPSRDQTLDWFMRSSDNALGLLTGGSWRLCVFDVDPRNGGDVTLERLLHQHGTEPFDAPVALTPSGGSHRYFRVPDGLILPTRTGMLPGIDVKAQKGLAVAPPSKRGAKAYRWATGTAPALDDLPQFPDLLIEMVLAKEPRRRSRTELGGSMIPAPTPKSLLTSDSAESDEFVDLWATLGIELQTGDHLYQCPFHDDTDPSLGIDSETHLWNCFACGAHGGLAGLRARIESPDADPLPTRVVGISPTTQTHTPSTKRNTDTDAERRHLHWCPEPLGLYQQASTVGTGFRVRCKQLTCPYCGERQRREQAEHYARGLLATGRPVFITLMPTEARESFARKVGRHDRVYLACPREDGISTVFTTLAMPDGATVPGDLMQVAVAKALAEIPLRRGRGGLKVSPSRSLAMPRTKKAKKPGVQTFPVGNLGRLADQAETEGKLLYRDGGGRTATERVGLLAPPTDTLEFIEFAARAGISPAPLGSAKAGRRLTPAEVSRYRKAPTDKDGTK